MAPPQVATDSICCFNNQCVCSWRRRCSPRIPMVTSRMDYSSIPSRFDGVPSSSGWSVLVGFISSLGNNSFFRLHRFRVARSGLIIGRSNDALEVVLHHVDYIKEEIIPPQICGATSTLSPDGSSLYLFSLQLGAMDVKMRHRPLQLHLSVEDERIPVSPLPGVPLGRLMRTRPISAAGELWAPCFSEYDGPPRLVMQRLDKDADRWVEVATMNLPDWSVPAGELPGRVLHGYAVVGDIILLSLQPLLFFTFNCSTCLWAHVNTAKTERSQYIPIHERAIYVEGHDSIYFLSRTVVYAYKLCKYQDEYWMAPPTMVDCLCPFNEEGYGFLTHLAHGLMCAVWISVSLRCGCDSRHTLITTFRVIGNKTSDPVQFFPKGVRIIHSTCRRLDITPSKPSASNCEFCFLQEYEDHFKDLRTLFSGVVDAREAFGSSVAESFVMLPCCREFRNEAPFLTAVRLDGFGIQIRKALYVICQTAPLSTVYKACIVDGCLDCHDKTITPHCTMAPHSSDAIYGMTERPLAWHFACTSEKIYAATRFGNELYICNLRLGITWKCGLYLSDSKTPSQLPISLIVQVGKKVIIISDTLQGVYEVIKGANTSRMELMHIPTHGSVDLGRKVILSGSVVLSDHIFIVFDADERCPYVLDLHNYQWSSVVTFPGFSRSLPGFRSGGSVFVDGFIYTCADGGLVAYEVTRRGHSFYISKQIYMEISWQKCWERDRMCLDYVGKNEVSGAIMLCVVQGGDYNSGDCPPCSHPLCITTIQVKIEKTDSGELRSVMHHVDTSTSFVEHEGAIWTRNCVIAAS